MKNLLLVLALILSFITAAVAQTPSCTVSQDTLTTYNYRFGFYPDPACGVVGVAYEELIHVIMPRDTTVTIGPVTQTIRFTEWRLDSVTNLPAGISFVVNSDPGIIINTNPLTLVPPNNTTPAYACMVLYGTPTVANTGSDTAVLWGRATTSANISDNFSLPVLRIPIRNTLAECPEPASRASLFVDGALSLAPNPATAATVLQFALKQSGSLYVDVLNTSGQVVAVVANEASAMGQQRFEIQTHELPHGLYLVRIRSNGQEFVQKFLKF